MTKEKYDPILLILSNQKEIERLINKPEKETTELFSLFEHTYENEKMILGLLSGVKIKEIVRIYILEERKKKAALALLNLMIGSLEEWASVYRDNNSLTIRNLCSQKITDWKKDLSFERLRKLFEKFSETGLRSIFSEKIMQFPMEIEIVVQKAISILPNSKTHCVIMSKLKKELLNITDRERLLKLLKKEAMTKTITKHIQERLSQI